MPPYGDPNQPYDRLPGTLKTYHVPWAKPLKGGPLKALFIVPYNDSREVVEAVAAPTSIGRGREGHWLFLCPYSQHAPQ